MTAGASIKLFLISLRAASMQEEFDIGPSGQDRCIHVFYLKRITYKRCVNTAIGLIMSISLKHFRGGSNERP